MPDEIVFKKITALRCPCCQRPWPAEDRFLTCPVCQEGTVGSKLAPISWPEAIDLAHHAEFSWYLYEHIDEWEGFPENWEDPDRPSTQPEQGDTVTVDGQ